MRKLILCSFSKLLIINKIKFLYEENSFAYPKFVSKILKIFEKDFTDEENINSICWRNILNEDR
jgi:hypothetical protein